MIAYVHRSGEIGFALGPHAIPATAMPLTTGPKALLPLAISQTALAVPAEAPSDGHRYVVPEIVDAGDNNDSARFAAEEYAVTLRCRLAALRRRALSAPARRQAVPA